MPLAAVGSARWHQSQGQPLCRCRSLDHWTPLDVSHEIVYAASHKFLRCRSHSALRGTVTQRSGRREQGQQATHTSPGRRVNRSNKRSTKLTNIWTHLCPWVVVYDSCLSRSAFSGPHDAQLKPDVLLRESKRLLRCTTPLPAGLDDSARFEGSSKHVVALCNGCCSAARSICCLDARYLRLEGSIQDPHPPKASAAPILALCC